MTGSSRLSFIIFRQDRYVGVAHGPTAEYALDLWVDTYKDPKPPGPFMAVLASEALERKMISEGIYRQAMR